MRNLCAKAPIIKKIKRAPVGIYISQSSHYKEQEIVQTLRPRNSLDGNYLLTQTSERLEGWGIVRMAMGCAACSTVWCPCPQKASAYAPE